jgi:hypothetical protein
VSGCDGGWWVSGVRRGEADLVDAAVDGEGVEQDPAGGDDGSGLVLRGGDAPNRPRTRTAQE